MVLNMTFDVSVEELAENYLDEVSIGTDETLEDFIYNYFFDFMCDAPFGLSISRTELNRLVKKVSKIVEKNSKRG